MDKPEFAAVVAAAFIACTIIGYALGAGLTKIGCLVVDRWVARRGRG